MSLTDFCRLSYYLTGNACKQMYEYEYVQYVDKGQDFYYWKLSGFCPQRT